MRPTSIVAKLLRKSEIRRVNLPLVGDPGAWRADGSTRPDLALLSIGEPVNDDGAPFDEVAPVALARVDRAAGVAVVERVRAIGHPLFAEISSATGTVDALVVREAVEAAGVIPVGSGLVRGLLDLQVSVVLRDLPPRHLYRAPEGVLHVPAEVVATLWVGQRC